MDSKQKEAIQSWQILFLHEDGLSKGLYKLVYFCLIKFPHVIILHKALREYLWLLL